MLLVLRLVWVMQVVGTSISAGKICARIDYHSFSPVATGVSEVLQTSIGAVASCNISEAGDYIVLQLSYQLRDTELEGYHDLPEARGAWSPLPARVSWDPEPDVWSWRLQLMAASIGISFLLLFVFIARRYRANAGMDRRISFRQYEVVDDKTDEDSKDPPQHSLSNSISKRFTLFQSVSQKNAEDDCSASTPDRSSPGWNRLKVLRAKSRESTTQIMNVTPARVASLAPSNENATEVLQFDEKAMAKMNDLLEMDARDARDETGRTALHLAASIGSLGMVRALLDAKDGSSDPRRTDYQGQTPVHTAAREGHNEVVAELVMLGCMREANPRPTSAGSDSDSGRGRRARQHSFSVNHQDQYGNTPLHLAAARGHTDVIRALQRTAVSIALDLSVANNDGWTPLQLAAQKGHTEAVMRLLKLNPRAAFPRAVHHGERCNASLTPLHIASRHGHVKLVRSLLDWISKNEEYLDAESSDDDDSRRSIDLLKPPITHRQTLAARSFKALKGIATKSKKTLHSMIQGKLPQQDVLDRGFTMSPVAASDIEEEGALVSTTAGDVKGEGLLVSDDTAPLVSRLAGGRPLSISTEAGIPQTAKPRKAAGSTSERSAARNATPDALTKRKGATSTLLTKPKSETEESAVEDILVASSVTPESSQLDRGPPEASGSSMHTTPVDVLGPFGSSSSSTTSSASRPSTPQLSEAQLAARHKKKLQVTSTGALAQVPAQESTPSAGRRRNPSTTEALHRRQTETAPASPTEVQTCKGYHTDDSEDNESRLPIWCEESSHAPRVTGWE